MSAIKAEYKTIKHIRGRSCYQIICEIPEENVGNLFETLGYPTTGESKWVGIARLNVPEKIGANSPQLKTEGEKLRTNAVMLCKDAQFQEFARNCLTHPDGIYGLNEQGARAAIVDYCGITSRSELATNVGAQEKLKELIAKFNDWLFLQQHKENIERM